jgi:hypothetical protein
MSVIFITIDVDRISMCIQSFIVGSYLKKRDSIRSTEVSPLKEFKERIAVFCMRQTNINCSNEISCYLRLKQAIHVAFIALWRVKTNTLTVFTWSVSSLLNQSYLH